MYGRPSCPPTLLHDVALSFTAQTAPRFLPFVPRSRRIVVGTVEVAQVPPRLFHRNVGPLLLSSYNAAGHHRGNIRHHDFKGGAYTGHHGPGIDRHDECTLHAVSRTDKERGSSMCTWPAAPCGRSAGCPACCPSWERGVNSRRAPSARPSATSHMECCSPDAQFDGVVEIGLARQRDYSAREHRSLARRRSSAS